MAPFQYCISGENTGEIGPTWPGLRLSIACSPDATGEEPTALCPGAAARVEVVPEPNQMNAITSPVQITTKGGMMNPDRQPPCEEKAVVWS
jgi:hypothetical protein